MVKMALPVGHEKNRGTVKQNGRPFSIITTLAQNSPLIQFHGLCERNIFNKNRLPLFWPSRKRQREREFKETTRVKGTGKSPVL